MIQFGIDFMDCLYFETNRFCRKFAQGHLKLPTIMANFLLALFFMLNALSISVFFVELPSWVFQVLIVTFLLLLFRKYPKIEDSSYKQPFGITSPIIALLYYSGSLIFLVWSTYTH